MECFAVLACIQAPGTIMDMLFKMIPLHKTLLAEKVAVR